MTFSSPLPLDLASNNVSVRPYGARSEEAVLVGDLLHQAVPSLASGEVEIVAIARQPGVLSKVAVQRGAGTRRLHRPVSLVLGIGADYVRNVRAQVGGERLHIVQFHRNPALYVADALGVRTLPPVHLRHATHHADVLLGEIDVHGFLGRGAVNLLLASALTGWRIRLRRMTQTSAWNTLVNAQAAGHSLPATVQRRTPKGLIVFVYGLPALLPIGHVRGVHRTTPRPIVDRLLHERLGTELQVTVRRLDPDAGHIFVAERRRTGQQLRLL